MNKSKNWVANNVLHHKKLFCLLLFLAATWACAINSEAFSTLPLIITISFISMLLTAPGQVLGVNIEVATDEYSNFTDTCTPNIHTPFAHTRNVNMYSPCFNRVCASKRWKLLIEQGEVLKRQAGYDAGTIYHNHLKPFLASKS